MAIKIKCPRCGNVGRVDGRDRRFEIRGVYKSKPVRKCLQCKIGLQLGLLSGTLIGQPNRIPERTWFDLEAQWSREFTPLDMPEGDQVELGLMLHSMFGFAHGYRRLLSEVESDVTPSPEQSFYLNALRTICISYFIGTSKSQSDVNVRNVLSKHDLQDLLEPIDEIMNTPLGSTRFERIMTRFRNKYLTHELFQLSPLEKIYSEFDMRDIRKWIFYHALERRLFDETAKLFYRLRARYPAAWIRSIDFEQ